MRAASGLVLLVLAACGGGGGSDSPPPVSNPPPPPPPPNASAGGIWEGQTSDGQQIVGLVAEGGEFHFITDDFVQYVGVAVTNVNAVTASYNGAVDFQSASFPDGSRWGSGTLNGTVRERQSITGTTSFTTANGSTNSGTITLAYSTLYDRDSSLATIAGNYVVPGGAILNISASGALFAQNPVAGCVTNGTVRIIDSRFNAYRIEYSGSGCIGQFAVLNGLQFTGIVTIDNSVTPEVIVGGVTAPIAGPPGSRLAAIVVAERT